MNVHVHCTAMQRAQKIYVECEIPSFLFLLQHTRIFNVIIFVERDRQQEGERNRVDIKSHYEFNKQMFQLCVCVCGAKTHQLRA